MTGQSPVSFTFCGLLAMKISGLMGDPLAPLFPAIAREPHPGNWCFIHQCEGEGEQPVRRRRTLKPRGGLKTRRGPPRSKSRVIVKHYGTLRPVFTC